MRAAMLLSLRPDSLEAFHRSRDPATGNSWLAAMAGADRRGNAASQFRGLAV